jgi:hypothetical protein
MVRDDVPAGQAYTLDSTTPMANAIHGRRARRPSLRETLTRSHRLSMRRGRVPSATGEQPCASGSLPARPRSTLSAPACQLYVARNGIREFPSGHGRPTPPPAHRLPPPATVPITTYGWWYEREQDRTTTGRAAGCSNPGGLRFEVLKQPTGQDSPRCAVSGGLDPWRGGAGRGRNAALGGCQRGGAAALPEHWLTGVRRDPTWIGIALGSGDRGCPRPCRPTDCRPLSAGRSRCGCGLPAGLRG